MTPKKVKKNINLRQMDPDCLLRLEHIVPDVIPIARSTWYMKIANGSFKIKAVSLGGMAKAYRVRDVLALLDGLHEVELKP
ncbi:hypothetical protein GO003_014705 [Methylicorpusculum oleiharenae]|uniref:helix-turn-helix transcriptional regulator n=1 Tax=Methylicorpusculum oleiharenae TaxID=1338687 RepID=UPI00135CEDC5|nr:hypothetical protein [Methylicorpusculum oleiharenae]MCD2451643.1 hypothetical protein [Methylicorpusculum oleiharenae]